MLMNGISPGPARRIRVKRRCCDGGAKGIEARGLWESLLSLCCSPFSFSFQIHIYEPLSSVVKFGFGCGIWFQDLVTLTVFLVKRL